MFISHGCRTTISCRPARRRKEAFMKYVIVGKNVEVSPALESVIHEKLGKLEKYLPEDVTAHVTLRVDKDRQSVEVTIPVRGTVIRTEQVTNDMYVSIDLAQEVLERQITKYRRKLIDRHRGGSIKEYEEDTGSDESEIRIVRHKQFEMKPMYPEDACVQMELLGHSFYMFINAETEQVNVVYKRKGGTYGLIEPDI